MVSLLWSSANFMKCLPLVVLSSLLTVFPLMAVERKPNIVYILADDLGFGDVHCLNPQRGRIATPHLDQLAKDGMTFTDAHSGASVCTPTRYGLLTGRYAWRTRLQAGVLDGSDDPPLIAADREMAPWFRITADRRCGCPGQKCRQIVEKTGRQKKFARRTWPACGNQNHRGTHSPWF